MSTVIKWNDVVDKDFPKEAPVTEHTLRAIKRWATYYRGSVRVSSGRILTEKKFSKRHKMAFRPLP
jgi:hypothetical protein